MGLDVTGGQIAVIVLIIMVAVETMWFEYLNHNPISNEGQSDYSSCINSCSRLSGNNPIAQCQIRCENLSVCIEETKEVEE